MKCSRKGSRNTTAFIQLLCQGYRVNALLGESSRGYEGCFLDSTRSLTELGVEKPCLQITKAN